MDEQQRRDTATPDPSSLTTAAILREIDNLEKLLTVRIDAVETAVKVAHENLVRVPTEVDKAIGHLKGVVDERGVALNERFATMQEKFASVQTQFAERDVRTEQTQRDSKVAVDAALQAAKEAVGKQQEASDRAIAKSEAATTKQIDSILSLIAANIATQDGKAVDLKERLTRIEGATIGHKESNTTLFAIMGVIIALAGLVFGYGIFKQNTAPVPIVVPAVDTAQNSRIDANTGRLDEVIRRLNAITPASKPAEPQR